MSVNPESDFRSSVGVVTFLLFQSISFWYNRINFFFLLNYFLQKLILEMVSLSDWTTIKLYDRRKS